MTQIAATQIQARKAGFINDVISVAIRALRGISRDPESIYPAIVIPVFFYAINIGALQDVAERMPGIDYKAFQLPVAIIFAVTGISRAVTLVTDIQTGYFDRLSLTPVNRLALLLGLTVADFTLVVVLTLPVVVMGFVVGVTFASGPLGHPAIHPNVGAVGPCIHGLPLRHRTQDRKPGGGKLQLSAVLSIRLHDDGVRTKGGDDGLAVDGRDLQPGHVSAGGR